MKRRPTAIDFPVRFRDRGQEASRNRLRGL